MPIGVVQDRIVIDFLSSFFKSTVPTPAEQDQAALKKQQPQGPGGKMNSPFMAGGTSLPKQPGVSLFSSVISGSR